MTNIALSCLFVGPWKHTNIKRLGFMDEFGTTHTITNLRHKTVYIYTNQNRSEHIAW